MHVCLSRTVSQHLVDTDNNTQSSQLGMNSSNATVKTTTAATTTTTIHAQMTNNKKKKYVWRRRIKEKTVDKDIVREEVREEDAT